MFSFALVSPEKKANPLTRCSSIEFAGANRNKSPLSCSVVINFPPSNVLNSFARCSDVPYITLPSNQGVTVFICSRLFSLDNPVLASDRLRNTDIIV